jgi:hypothetical protein
MADRIAAKFIEAGCEKLPEGPMRDNCEKKKKDDGGEKKEAAKGEVPEAFKKEWKNKDKDNDGKENEPMPEGLKKHMEKKSSEPVPKGVVAAMTKEGKVEIFDAETPKEATALKEALQDSGDYTRIASGQNAEGRTASELYGYFEERWADEE